MFEDMKHILTIGLAIMLSLTALAQSNVTQFLGIPIDGTKSAMIQKLKNKGYGLLCFVLCESWAYIE